MPGPKNGKWTLPRGRRPNYCRRYSVGMASTLLGILADRFAIRPYCECGHEAALPLGWALTGNTR